jgi:predicted secreted protein
MKSTIYVTYMLCCASMFLIMSGLNAQPPTVLWSHTYGGGASEKAFAAEVTTDGGFVLIGYTTSYGAGGKDIWIIKTNALGDVQWESTHGGPADEEGLSIAQTNDGGYVAAGACGSQSAGHREIWVLKLDENGDLDWDRTLAGDWGYSQSIKQTSDGGFIIAGEYSSGEWGYSYWGPFQLLLVKINSAGIEQWRNSWGTSLGHEHGFDVIETTGGEYVVTGMLHDVAVTGAYDLWLIKVDANGNELWNRVFAGSNLNDVGHSVCQTNEAGFITAGYKHEGYGSSMGGGGDMWLLKTDENGLEEWDRSFGDLPGANNEMAYSVKQTQEGGYIVAGFTQYYGAGGYDAWIIKTDTEGLESWNIPVGGSQNDQARFVAEIATGRYVIVGWTSSYGSGSDDFWLCCLGPPTGIIQGAISPTFSGLTVDLYKDGAPSGSTLTSEGAFSFSDLEPGDYAVELIVPLGFTVDENPKLVNVAAGQTAIADFTLTSLITSNTARSKGYWKHQVNANGNTDYSQAGMLDLSQEIYDHFYGNPVHAIEVDGVTFAADSSCALSICDMRTMLNINQNGSTMYERACQQYLTLLLNLAANKVGQLTLASADGVTHSQAVVYIHQLLGVNNELAKNIAETLNNAQMVANGVIPLTTPNVIFGNGMQEIVLHPSAFSLQPASPNPFNPSTTLTFTLPAAARVKLSVFNISGREVARLVDSFRDAGIHEVIWDAAGLPSGIYCARLDAGSRSAVQKLMLLK